MGMRHPILDFGFWIWDWLGLERGGLKPLVFGQFVNNAIAKPSCLIGLFGFIFLVSVSCQSVKPPTGQPPLIERIRLLGISAPDLQQQPWGGAARENLAKILGSQASVLLEFDGEEKDAYQRRSAYVWHEGKLLNEILVARGYALARGQFNPKYSQQLARAQEYARIMGYGIWNPEKPMRQTPDEFRATKLTPPAPPKSKI
jgi:micrococcal nuclease